LHLGKSAPTTASAPSNAELEQELEPDSYFFKPNPERIWLVLQELLWRRNVRPEARHYKALILANAGAEAGTAINVRSLLEEMEREGVRVDSGVLHAALRVCMPSVEVWTIELGNGHFLGL